MNTCATHTTPYCTHLPPSFSSLPFFELSLLLPPAPADVDLSSALATATAKAWVQDRA